MKRTEVEHILRAAKAIAGEDEFILLGSQVNFALMGKYLWGGVALVAVFMLVARPITVFCCTLPDRRSRAEIGTRTG